MLKGFREFIARGNVVDLAVAVIIGGAFGQIVNSLVSDVITPIIGSLGGVPDFSQLKVGSVALGKFINAVVNFLVVSAAIYFLVVAPMQKIKERVGKSEPPPAPPEPSEEAKLLKEILETLRQQRS